ncbi:Rne/Rng family ribonuclease [Nocardioides pocheonensis]|uniref:Rne/Rng family ribonuclease n=1 Tax=Nocardioides pocheonensis TaxID=661485 RepID=UPI0026793701
MLDADDTTGPETPETPAGGDAGAAPPAAEGADAPVKKAAKKAAKKTTKKAPAKKTAKKAAAPEAGTEVPQAGAEPASEAPGAAEAPEAAEAPRKTAKRSRKAAAAPAVLFQAPEATPTRKRAAKATAASAPAEDAAEAAPVADGTPGETEGQEQDGAAKKTAKKAAKKTAKKAAKKTTKARSGDEVAEEPDQASDAAQVEGQVDGQAEGEADDSENGEGGPRRRRRRGGRRRRRGAGDDGAEGADETPSGSVPDEREDSDDEGGEEGGTRRRRTRVRKPRNPEDEITGVAGSTRLEAKKQRRREGREAGRRRAPIVSEAEFLARRESVERVMVIRQRGELTQIGVLEDKVLVEHYVARESQTSLIGNIYLGRVQNVLPSMEAAFVDIGKGRNAVLYAGEVNWSALGHKEGQPRKIESVLKSGQTILVQVTKDPVGHKGARLTGQISLPGRFLVYVPDGTTSGISRKLPDTERNRLKTLLKEIVPDTAGVIVRTAAEGASEDELTHDVERLTARWAEIEKRVEAGKGPELLYGEPDLTLKVVRDLFTEDFSRLVVEGDDAWDLVEGYVEHVAPDLKERLERYESKDGRDIFAAYRIDEQIAKGVDRKVWLPSGGSLVIDRTEAMTVVDVNTGKFTGSGGNLEETVTKNNLEAAEEIVRQLRLRDIGGIIVIDFIDMVLESNRDLVLRRLVECLGRDRTRHQVAEVTSLGLVQMTRKRIGTGLLEAFSEECEHCKGRGLIVHEQPVEPAGRGGSAPAADEARGRRGRGGRTRGRSGETTSAPVEPVKPSPMALAGSKPPAEGAARSAEVEQETVPVEVEQGTDEGNERELTGDPVEAALVGEAPDEASEPPLEITWAGVTAPEPGPGDAAEAAPGPIVVTSTRRRRAGRPAGPPAASAEVQEPDAEAAEAQADATTPAAGDDDREAASVDASAQNGAAPEVQDLVDGVAADAALELDEADNGHPLVHVPVKKKGSRKR